MGNSASRLNLEELFHPERRRVRELESQLRSNNEELRRLRDQLRELQQNRDPSRDWVINRKHIQITGQELGRGAWGVVYLGRFHGCEVAVKQMYDEILSDRNRHLFEREVDIASKCRHPCLLQFIGATADNQTPLLVTELMECSLRERICSITAEDVTVICLDVARALNYLHQKPLPIIHHDVSSANVLLRRQRNQWQAKLSDYGTANFVRQSNINYAGALIYCAPESRREDPDRPISVKVGNDTSSFDTKCGGFQLSVEINPVLFWFCFISLFVCSAKLVPLSQPMRSKTKTNHDLRSFPSIALHTPTAHNFTPD